MKSPLSFGKLPRRPTGAMGSAQFGRGWTRVHNVDQYPGQPKRKTDSV